MDSFLEDQFYREPNIFVIRQLILTLSCHIQSICGGCVYGMSSILLPQLEQSQEIVLDKDQQSWIASIPTLMLIPNVLLAALLIDKLGRRKAFMFSQLLTSSTWITMYLANSYAILLVGRGLGGTFIGYYYPTVLSYIGETTKPEIRPACLASITLGCTMGILLVQLLGIYMHWKTICLILIVIPLCTLMVTIFYLKESYIWYINKENKDEARTCFVWYRGKSSRANDEFQAALFNDSPTNKWNFKEKIQLCFSKRVIYPFSLTCLLFLTSEFSGDIAIVFYTSHFIKIVTTDPSIQYYSTLILNTLRVISTGISCILLKKLSLRKVWIGSGFCVTFTLFNCALFLYMSNAYPENRAFSLISIASIILNVIFFALGLGPLPTVICGELYPAPARSIGSAISSFVAFGSIFCIVKMMPYMFNNIDSPVIFVIFGTITVSGVIISCFVLPDTKGKTLKELETFYES